MRPMNVLVTGGLGVNGIWVTRRLSELGHHVVVFENRADADPADLGENVEIVVGDILDVAGLIRAATTHDVDVIAHLAALMPDAAQDDPLLGFTVNATGTVSVLEAARSTGVRRVVFASSKGALAPCLGEYGYPTYKPVDESYPARPEGPTTVYGAAKVASELMGNAYADLFGLEFVALRFATIYGPGKGARHGALAVYGQMIENAMNGIATVIEQGGDEKNDVIYVKDIANAVASACLSTLSTDRLFHIGSGVGTTYADFADAVRELYPEADFTIGPGLRKTVGLACVMDASNAREVLGWAPQFRLADGIADYVTTLSARRGDDSGLAEPMDTPPSP
jgi:UDP-glucose 4-epimerase